MGQGPETAMRRVAGGILGIALAGTAVAWALLKMQGQKGVAAVRAELAKQFAAAAPTKKP